VPTICRTADLAMQNSRFDEALALYARAVDEGDPRAYFGLGWMALKGYGGPENLARALELFEAGALLGDGDCAMQLAGLLAQGKAGEQRRGDSMRWYERALELGREAARARIGLLYKDGWGVTVDHVRAEQLWRESIRRGVVGARVMLARLLVERGEVVAAANEFLCAHVEGSRDGLVGLDGIGDRLRELAEQGDAQAQYFVGVRHFIAKRMDEGMPWIRASAAAGCPASLRALAFVHSGGEGVDQDRELARQLYERAAAGGDPTAQCNLALLVLQDDPDAQAKRTACELLRAAAQQNNGDAMRRLGALLVELDELEEARTWLELSALRGDPGSRIALGCLLRDGRGGPVDLVEAARWLIAALRQGNADGVHEMHDFVHRMTHAEIREAARRAGDLEDAEAWILHCEAPPDAR